MDLSINSTFLEGYYNNDEVFRLCGQAGFECVDFNLHPLTQDSHVLSGPNYREAAEQIRKSAEQNGLRINQVHGPAVWRFEQWTDETYFEEVIFPRHIRSLEVAGILGAKVAVTHPLHHYPYRGHAEEIFDLNMKFYSRMIPYAKEYGVKVGVENMWQYDQRRKHIIADTCANLDEFIRYIDTLNSEWITACIDIGHTTLVDHAEEPWDFIRGLGHDRLGSLHVHDNNYRDDTHTYPYNGKIDWREVTRALGEIDYQGDFTYELTSPWAKYMDHETVTLQTKYLADLGHSLIRQIDNARPGACH